MIKNEEKQLPFKKDFDAYERVRQSGKFNMFTQANLAATAANLSPGRYWEVLHNYRALREKYRDEALAKLETANKYPPALSLLDKAEKERDSALEGMKKRLDLVEELSELRLRDLQKHFKRAYELEAALQTAEDKLAASEKECEEQARLNGMGSLRQLALMMKIEEKNKRIQDLIGGHKCCCKKIEELENDN